MSDQILNLIRKDLLQFNAYSSARDEAKHGKIWMNANESPWPLDEIQPANMNRYPEKQPAELIQRLAKIYDVRTDQISLLRGSGEAIDLLIRLFCTAGKDALMICPPTFGLYGICASLQGAQIIEAPLSKDADFQLDLSVIQAHWTPAVKIIFLCNPNNPTGTLLKEADIIHLCEAFSEKSMIVVDEAYIEFSSSNSLTKYINTFENLAILRTFSKAYGLAGARLGVLLAQKELILWINAIMAPYPLPSLTIQAGLDITSPTSLKKIQQQITCIKTERTRLINTLKQLPIIIKIWPSEANYILIKATDSQKIMDECGAHGIVLRHMHNRPYLENCIRISIGLPEENSELIKILKNVSV
jgi:histidinol-phosphate aminotransferase